MPMHAHVLRFFWLGAIPMAASTAQLVLSATHNSRSITSISSSSNSSSSCLQVIHLSSAAPEASADSVSMSMFTCPRCLLPGVHPWRHPDIHSDLQGLCEGSWQTWLQHKPIPCHSYHRKPREAAAGVRIYSHTGARRLIYHDSSSMWMCV